ncbi:MAG: hypothetical protein K0Q99_1264 [Clostridia bacterium]|jgi:hypothetical protein|nr:hypothetical protein [Clostridia bacterium]
MNLLKVNIKKNKMMIRQGAPVTIESTGFTKISRGMEKICHMLKEKNR